jgi:hypothetical protein
LCRDRLIVAKPIASGIETGNRRDRCAPLPKEQERSTTPRNRLELLNPVGLNEVRSGWLRSFDCATL